jgi:hypothetical protein
MALRWTTKKKEKKGIMTRSDSCLVFRVLVLAAMGVSFWHARGQVLSGRIQPGAWDAGNKWEHNLLTGDAEGEMDVTALESLVCTCTSEVSGKIIMEQ